MILTTSNDTTLKVHSIAETTHKLSLNLPQSKRDILKLELFNSTYALSIYANSK